MSLITVDVPRSFTWFIDNSFFIFHPKLRLLYLIKLYVFCNVTLIIYLDINDIM